MTKRINVCDGIFTLHALCILAGKTGVGGGHGRRIQKSVVARPGGVARLVVIVDGIVLPEK